METVEETTAAYIAGFFDADGSVSYHTYQATKNGKRYWRLQAKVSQKYPEVLYWIKERVGVGSVGGNTSGHYAHDFIVSSKAARTFLNIILPYIKVKRKKVLECLQLDAERAQRKPVAKNSWQLQSRENEYSRKSHKLSSAGATPAPATNQSESRVDS